MTPFVNQAHRVPMPNRWRSLIERFLPWYDAKVERARDEHTEAIRRESIAVRIDAERVRENYREAGDRVKQS